MMGIYGLLAEAFRYPAAGSLEALEVGLAALPPGAATKHFKEFLESVASLSLGEWEELHTRTLDLNPPAAPYVGYQTWGESYKRGNFMALVKSELNRYEIDPDGELPDHLAPILLYLESVPQPISEVLEVLGPSVQKMRQILNKKDPANPYLSLFDAILHLPRLEKKTKRI